MKKIDQKPDLAKMRALHEAGLLIEAKTEYLAALKKHPDDADILHAAGIVSAQLDELDEAIYYFNQAIRYRPQDPALQLHLANALKIKKFYSEAITVLKKTIANHPEYVPAYNNLGIVYFVAEDMDNAIQSYQTAIQKAPEYIDAYYNLGLTFLKQGKYLEGIEVYEKLLTLSPDHFAARFKMTSAQMQKGNIDEALKNFLIIEKNYPYHFETETNLATCYLKKGALQEAKSHYKKALELIPDDIQILFNLGIIYTELGDMDHAIQCYQKVVSLDPNHFAAHNNLGTAFLTRQHPALALQHFKEAHRLQPKSVALDYIITALSKNQRLFAAPADYVAGLFDAYADHYEVHLLNALDYKVHALLSDAIFKLKRPAHQAWDILDAGCGTGLCGAFLKLYAKQLIGVDLSAEMLKIAKSKNIYDELILDDITHYIENKTNAFDLIMLGDVLVYMGDLDYFFKNVHQALKPQGLCVFNTEISNAIDYQMNQSGRFAHQKQYLDDLAKKYQFKILSYSAPITRTQNNEPVYGHLYVLEK